MHPDRLRRRLARFACRPGRLAPVVAFVVVVVIAVVGESHGTPPAAAIALALPGLLFSPAVSVSLVLAYSASPELLQGGGPGPFAAVDLLLLTTALRCLVRPGSWTHR